MSSPLHLLVTTQLIRTDSQTGDIDIFSRTILQSGLIILDGGHQSGIGLARLQPRTHNCAALLLLAKQTVCQVKVCSLLNSCEDDSPRSVALFITFNPWDQEAHS